MKIFHLLKKIIPLKTQDFIYKKIVSPVLPSRNLYKLSSYSQAGEDAVLRFLFLDRGIDLSNVSYLDIGARHPTCGNNTFLFYTFGSKGVCVDADKEYIKLLKKIRPRDKVLNVGVTNSEEKSGHLMFLKNGGSTLSVGEFRKRKGATKQSKNDLLAIKLLTINKLIKEKFSEYPTFLSIDIEGLDLPVLKSLNYEKYPIPVICAETCKYSENYIRPKDKRISNFLLSKGYEVYADTYVNTIFVNRKWFYEKLQ